MAKLVEVCRPGDTANIPHQLPMVIEPNLVMVAQFSDDCTTCGPSRGRSSVPYSEFYSKYKLLAPDELRSALTVTTKDLLNDLTQSVPCVGCRRCVEGQLGQIIKYQHASLDPLSVVDDKQLQLRADFFMDSKKLYRLFQTHAGKLSAVVESFPKSRKNKRCAIHSLEMHKTRSLGFVQSFLTGIWPDVWYSMNKDCREEVTIIDYPNLSEALDDYLHKHRFCGECKNKVLRAYRLLTKEETINTVTPPPAAAAAAPAADSAATADGTAVASNGQPAAAAAPAGDAAAPSAVAGGVDKGCCYNPALYAKISACTADQHIHVECTETFVRSLITRAEPEIKGSGNGRERHAKTLDVAQEEVLTCIGVLLYDRLYVIWQRLKTEEQAWLILFHLATDVLQQGFELAIEKKCGMSRLERTCLELIDCEQLKLQRRQLKRERRKKNKAAALTAGAVESCGHSTEVPVAKEPGSEISNSSSGRGVIFVEADGQSYVVSESGVVSLAKHNAGDCGKNNGSGACRTKRTSGGHVSAIVVSQTGAKRGHESSECVLEGQVSAARGNPSAVNGHLSAENGGHGSAIWCDSKPSKRNKKGCGSSNNSSNNNNNNNNRDSSILVAANQSCDCLVQSSSNSSGRGKGVSSNSCGSSSNKQANSSSEGRCIAVNHGSNANHCVSSNGIQGSPNDNHCTASNNAVEVISTSSKKKKNSCSPRRDNNAESECSCSGEVEADDRELIGGLGAVVVGEGVALKPSSVGGVCTGDCGYSSGVDGCEALSAHSSNDGSSDTLCSEACCTADGDGHSCDTRGAPRCTDCGGDGSKLRHHSPLFGSSVLLRDGWSGGQRFSSALSLVDMLEGSSISDDEEDGSPGISEEEIARFRSNRKLLETERNQLRQRLRQNFDRMRQKHGYVGVPARGGSTNP